MAVRLRPAAEGLLLSLPDSVLCELVVRLPVPDRWKLALTRRSMFVWLVRHRLLPVFSSRVHWHVLPRICCPTEWGDVIYQHFVRLFGVLYPLLMINGRPSPFADQQLYELATAFMLPAKLDRDLYNNTVAIRTPQKCIINGRCQPALAPEDPDRLSTLPEVVLARIAYFLPPDSIWHLATTCHVLMYQMAVWRLLPPVVRPLTFIHTRLRRGTDDATWRQTEFTRLAGLASIVLGRSISVAMAERWFRPFKTSELMDLKQAGLVDPLRDTDIRYIYRLFRVTLRGPNTPVDYNFFRKIPMQGTVELRVNRSFIRLLDRDIKAMRDCDVCLDLDSHSLYSLIRHLPTGFAEIDDANTEDVNLFWKNIHGICSVAKTVTLSGLKWSFLDRPLPSLLPQGNLEILRIRHSAGDATCARISALLTVAQRVKFLSIDAALLEVTGSLPAHLRLLLHHRSNEYHFWFHHAGMYGVVKSTGLQIVPMPPSITGLEKKFMGPTAFLRLLKTYEEPLVWNNFRLLVDLAVPELRYAAIINVMGPSPLLGMAQLASMPDTAIFPTVIFRGPAVTELINYANLKHDVYVLGLLHTVPVIGTVFIHKWLINFSTTQSVAVRLPWTALPIHAWSLKIWYAMARAASDLVTQNTEAGLFLFLGFVAPLFETLAYPHTESSAFIVEARTLYVSMLDRLILQYEDVDMDYLWSRAVIICRYYFGVNPCVCQAARSLQARQRSARHDTVHALQTLQQQFS
jgi:hypothetical protein